jgi:hypothetical protein
LAADHISRSAAGTTHGVVDELRRATAGCCRIADELIAGGLGHRLVGA